MTIPVSAVLYCCPQLAVIEAVWIIVFSQCCLICTHMYMTNNFDWSVTFARFFSVSFFRAFHGQHLFCNISILEVRRVSFSDSSITNGSELWVCGTFSWNFVQTIEFKNIPTILFGADTALHSIGLELYKFFPFDFQHFESLPFEKIYFLVPLSSHPPKTDICPRFLEQCPRIFAVFKTKISKKIKDIFCIFDDLFTFPPTPWAKRKYWNRPKK